MESLVESLSLRNVDKIVGGEVYLKNINLEFNKGSRYILLGRTLAGKTSLLRVLAGLDKPSSGKIFRGEQDVTGLSVRKRNIAMVYQQFINYPSMTVFDNIASPLKFGTMKKNEIEQQVQETAKMLHIDPFLGRLPAELSGGQQQRTAIARALVKDSELLILDEPLVNLDYKLREELRDELQEIFRQRDSIVVYSTTEPGEALMLGGNIVVIDEGRVLQQGDTSTVFRNPESVKVSQVFSDPPVNLIEGKIEKDKGYLGTESLPLKGHLAELADGDVVFGVRPSHLSMSKKNNDDVTLDANITLVEISGSESYIHLSFKDKRVVVQEDGIFHYKIGEPVNAFVNPADMLVFDPAGALVAAPD